MPGTVEQWDEALDRYGSMSLRKLLQPGIDVARRGFEVDQTFVDQTTPNVDYFNDIPATAAIYLDPDGTPRDVGSTLRNPDLARTYERIAEDGPRAFYRGRIARAIADAVAGSADGTRRQPRVAAGPDDRRTTSARYDAPWRKPTRIDYKGLDVWGMGPPSSGGSTVGEALNILEGYRPLGADRTQALHRYLEASRYAFADRNAYLGDPDYVDVPLRCLLSDAFAAERRALITEHGGQRRRRARRLRRAGQHVARRGGPVDDAPDGRRQARLRRLLHVHDRVDRRQRHRRPRLRVPAQQRADGLQHQRPRAPQRARGRQAAAQLDGADDHHARRATGAGRRLARAAR